MDSKTYYGEYTLEYWIELMLSNNITLPEYQRSFVWKETNVRRLITSLKNHQFVQPVTIALMKNNNVVKGCNLILDGQQRLTSILLSKLGYIPDCEKFENIEELPVEDDLNNNIEIDESDSVVKPIKWTFKEMLSDNPKENSISKIRERLSKDVRYKKLEFKDLNDNFYEKNFLGFSYIVPNTNEENEIRESFTRLFRSINYFGAKLSPLESRRSLYFMNSNLHDYFEGIDEKGDDVLCGISIGDNKKICKLDYVRYLSTLSQYYSDTSHDIRKVMKWYSNQKTRESYYADYVSYLLNVDQECHENKFDSFDFNKVFKNGLWRERYGKLKDTFSSLMPKMDLNEGKHASSFKSWIDADYWLFGMIYYIVFDGKQIKEDATDLVSELITEIILKKEDKDGYAKNPNQLGFLRERLKKSIEIYSKYVY